jgi:GntR family phosphonate transport system transcriptional regulator
MMAPDRGVLWLDLTRRIHAMMAESGLGPGDRLPTEALLADRFGVNRHTVRRALKHMEEKGNIEARQGRGRFVRMPAIHYQIGARPRFSNILADQDIVPRTELIELAVEVASDIVAHALSLRPRSKVVHVERLGLANDNPISLSSHYLPLGRFPRFIEAYRQTPSITAALAECGVIDYTRRSTQVSSRLPTARERELLGTPRHVPLLVTRSTNVDVRGWAIEYGEARMASDRVELVITLPPQREG